MNVERGDLDSWARACLRIHQKAESGRLAAQQGRVSEAASRMEDAGARAWRLMRDLIAAGAERPQELRPAANPPELRHMDTPANRRLLAALIAARDAAEEVDKERGDYLDGFAEVIEHFATGVEAEVYRPRGRE